MVIMQLIADWRYGCRLEQVMPTCPCPRLEVSLGAIRGVDGTSLDTASRQIILNRIESSLRREQRRPGPDQ
jgi:hypothetical protein